MNRVDAGGERGADNRANIEVAFRWPGGPDADGVVGQPGRHRIAVRVRYREHRLDAEPLTAAHDADGNLAPVGNENSPERSRGPSCLARVTSGHPASGSIRIRASSCSANRASGTQISATVPRTPA